MYGINTLFILTQTVILMGLLYLFARKEGYLDFGSLLITMCIVILGNFVLFAVLLPKLLWFTALPIFGFTAWMIVKRCDVSWSKSVLITFLYFVLSGAVETGKAWYFRGRLPWQPAPLADDAPQNNYDAAMQEGLAVFKDLQESTARMQAAAEEGLKNEQAESSIADLAREIDDVEAAQPAVADAAPVAATKPAVVVQPATPPPPVVELPSGTQPDWDMARSLLRIRGWMDDANGPRTALLASGSNLPVGGTTSVDLGGIRYTWKLSAMNGYQPVWHPVSAKKIE